MTGCLKNFLAAVGCVTLLVLAAGAAWLLRDQIAGAYRSMGGRHQAAPAADSALVGRPSAAAGRQAEAKQASLSRRGGPASAWLSPDETAALLEAGLDPAARRAIDSLTVELGDDRLTVRGWLVIDVLERRLLGPLDGLLQGREPMLIAGPIEAPRRGRLVWRPDSFLVRAFPVPRAVVPRLLDRLTGGSNGAVTIAIAETVGDVRVRPDGMTLYRTR